MSEKGEPMRYPDKYNIGHKTLKVWIANAKTPEEAAQYKAALGKSAARHQKRKVDTGKVKRNKQ